jgi:hypothetical protein
MRLFYSLLVPVFLLFASANTAAASCSNGSTINGKYFCLLNNSTDLTFELESFGSNHKDPAYCINTATKKTYPGEEVSFWFATKRKDECNWGAMSYGIYKNGARIGGLNFAIGNNEGFTNHAFQFQRGYVYKVGQYYGNDAQFGVALDESSAGPNFDCKNNGEVARCSPENTTGKLNY